MKNIAILFIFFLSLAFSSCETVVDLDLEQSEPRLSVEAIVTDAAEMNYVKLAMSAPYARNIEPQAVPDAQVKLTDNAGNSFDFIHEADGLYKPANGFVGVVGRTYTLTIEARGQTYTATSVIHPVPELANLIYEYVDGKNDDFGRTKGYYLTMAFQDEAGVKNYYKIDLYQNNKFRQKNPNEMLVTDDRLFDGSYLEDNSIFIPFEKGDRIDMHLMSLTKEACDFYRAINMLAAQGGFFGRTPANLPTNISNGGVGFFSASAVSSRTIIIE